MTALLAAPNFFLFVFASVYLGGDAINGYVKKVTTFSVPTEVALRLVNRCGRIATGMPSALLAEFS